MSPYVLISILVVIFLILLVFIAFTEPNNLPIVLQCVCFLAVAAIPLFIGGRYAHSATAQAVCIVLAFVIGFGLLPLLPIEFPTQPDTTTCEFCESTIYADVRFCPSCGERLPDSTSSLTCAGCEAELSEGDKFCSSCGESTGAAPKG